jgi:hypothetical protein
LDELFKQLVIPLLGGFLFIWFNHRARFLLLPAGGEKFFLACGVLGAFGLVIGTFVSHALTVVADLCPVPWVKELHKHWHEWVPFSLAQMLALAGLPAVGLLLNKVWPRDEAYGLAMATSGDTLEVFFEQAILESRLILLSLRSGRIYVGKIEETIKPLTGRRHIKIVPFMSGFRWPLDTEHDGAAKMPNRVHWSTLYKDIVQAVLSIGKNSGTPSQDPFLIKIPGPSGVLLDVDAREMGLVISIDDIESATRFNQRVYAYLNRDRYPYVLEKLKAVKSGSNKPGDAAAGKGPGG